MNLGERDQFSGVHYFVSWTKIYLVFASFTLNESQRLNNYSIKAIDIDDFFISKSNVT